VVLEKDGEGQSGCSYGQWRNMTKIQGGKEHPTYNKMKADCIGHILLWYSLLKRFTASEGKTEGNIAGTRKEEEYVCSYWISLEGGILEFEIGNFRSYSVENSFWKRLWTCSKRDNVLNYAGKSELKRRKIEGSSKEVKMLINKNERL
jgi:hypothetical protein